LLRPETLVSRPITDRVKESLFNVLCKYDLPTRSTSSGQGGKFVADLFCGVGSLGLEALSRGAEFVTFVEQDPKIAAILNRNIEKAGFVKESKVIKANAFKIGAPVDFIVTAENAENTEKKNNKMRIKSQRFRRDEILKISANSAISAVKEKVGRQWGTMALTVLEKK